MRETKKFRLDCLIIIVIVIIGAIMGLFLLLSKEQGNYVQIRVDGVVVEEHSLQEDGIYEIHGVNGGSNYLEITKGHAQMTEASCPDGLCINMGKIDKVGQSIVCLPNKVVVEVVSEAPQNNDVDVVTGIGGF